MPRQPIFHTAEALPPQRRAIAERALVRFPGAFLNEGEALRWLNRISMPASSRWAFVGNAKTGSSSIKRFLFLLEFGIPLTVSFDSPSDINPDAVSHALTRAGVFRTLSSIPSGLMLLSRALRLATSRHPVARAISSFNYICQTDIESSPWMLGERLRMNATCGFDWSKDRFTPDGFLKFLDHLALINQQSGEPIDDPHLRPQVRNVRPEIFKPDLVGRTENLHGFFRAIAERLDTPLPPDIDLPISNRQNSATMADTLITSESKRRIASVFAADFQWLNEDVDSWAP